MKDVTPEQMKPENDVQEALRADGLDLVCYVKKLKAELNAKENKAQIPKGESDFVYSKNMIAWQIRQKARQDLGQHWGAESAAESKANLTIEVVTFKKGDCRETNAE